ncbi:helix-turn-helix domain-containing protein [Hungatella effluvii]|uniref:helix-turn-helix domain-containing protein n=1 Tax=Hungatella effluvii TaxID=1096246 RepID=UPI0022E6BD91|nr:helix-turn-helix transcriptional regulator [Hungatella effluvii]
MRTLDTLLRYYIERSGYTIYGIAKIADVKRSTLQKVLTENRKPSRELIEKLIPYLKLSPDEKDDLMEITEILNVGEEVFYQRQFIRRLLEHTADILLGRVISFKNATGESCPLHISYENAQFFHGNYAVENLLNIFLSNTAQKGHSEIRTNIPGNSELFSNVLKHIIYYCPDYCNLRVRHFVLFHKNIKEEKLATDNLKIFYNIIPFMITSDFLYEVNYYYDSGSPIIKDALTAFPYFVIEKEWGVLLSEDCNSAVFVKSEQILEYLNNLYESFLSRTEPLATICTKPEDILPILLELNRDESTLFVLENQPCFSAFLTEGLIRKYAKKDIPEYESVVQTLCKRSRQLQNLTAHISIFSKSGLQHFVETGYINDLTPEYSCPLEIKDRQYLLNCLYQAIEKNTMAGYMINPLNLHISEDFSYLMVKNKGLIFFGYNAERRNYHYILLKEATLLEAFYDFSLYITNSSCVYSKEDTLDCLKQYMVSLQQ